MVSPDLPVLFEDESLIAVDKPSGLPVHGSGEGEETVETVLRKALRHRAVRSGFTVTAVHRLDKETSGVLVLARRRRAAQRLQEQFAAGTVQKRYLALVLRGPPQDELLIDLPLPGLGKHAGQLQEARTSVRVLQRGPEAALVECTPHTGRTHQIRRHLNAIGCPIAGDPLYGGERFLQHAREAWGLQRLFLHAAALTLQHPDTGDELTLNSPLPQELVAVLSAQASP